MIRLVATATLFAAIAVATPALAQIMTAEPTYFEARSPLTEAEMKATFSGKYHEDGTDKAGNDWSVDASADGSLRVSSGAYTDTGRARLDGLRLCVIYTKWKGQERCYRYAHHGKQLASYGPDGNLDSVVTVSR